jgi:hypothetical protein
MACLICMSHHEEQFPSEINIHFPNSHNPNLNKPTVWVFPKLLVCLDCGSARLCIPETELAMLAKGVACAPSLERLYRSSAEAD